VSTAAELDAISTEQIRSQRGVKWTRYGDDVIGAFVAEMDFGTAPAVTAAVHRAVDTVSLGYLPDWLKRDLAAACSRWHRDRYGVEVDPARIFPIPDVIRGLEIAISVFSPPGSPVVLTTPAYMPFFSIPPRLGREIIEVPMFPGEDGRPTLDLDGIGAAFEAGGGVLILCNPYNPLGRVFTRDELAALATVVERHGGRVFADEVHGPLVYGETRHVPYASVSTAAAAHSITSMSASKGWNLPGMKCAQLILSADDDLERWEADGMWIGRGASNLGVVADTAAYDDGREWLDGVVHYLDGNRLLLAELLAEHIPAVRYTAPEGTYLAWLECRELDLGPAPGEHFLERAGVALVDGADCGGPGHVRLNFATPRPVLVEIVRRMSAAVEG
jgi:cysteine-S-conjugate beta-lyase